MAHNLDTTNGVTSFVSAREHAWHGLGQILDGAMDSKTALEQGMLAGWNLRKTELETTVDDQRLVIPNQFSIVRNNPVVAGQLDVLGTVGNAYHIVQNEELTQLLDILVDESGAYYETAGAIDGGRRVFVSMRMPGHIRIGGIDPVNNYIVLVTSHDGSLSTSLMVTPIRVVCQNTMNLAFQNATNQFKVRHTKGASRVLLEQTRKALEFTHDYLDGFQEEAERLINTTMTQGQFESIIYKEFSAPEDAPVATKTRAENKILQMAELFADAFTQEGVRGTAWAGLNALTEWNDHYSPVRNLPGVDELSTRHRKAIFDPDFKNRALALMTSA